MKSGNTVEKQEHCHNLQVRSRVRSPTLVFEGAVHAPSGLTAAISPSAVADSFVRRRSDGIRLLTFQRSWLTHIKL